VTLNEAFVLLKDGRRIVPAAAAEDKKGAQSYDDSDEEVEKGSFTNSG
jgi:hypothetical protein